MSSILDTIVQAITRQEGSGARNNNPGNIMDYAYYQTTGQFRLAQFPSLDDGVQALKDLIAKRAPGLTLREFFGGKPGVYTGYAPAGHGANDPDVYARNVANALGISPDEVITTLGDSPGNPTHPHRT